MRTVLATTATLLCIAPVIAQAPGLRAGLWQSTTVIAGEKPMVASECEPARPAAALARYGMSDNPNCTWQRRTVQGGVVDIAASCPTPGGRVQSTVKGSYTPTGMTMTVVTTLAGKPVTMRTTSKWIGGCDPEE